MSASEQQGEGACFFDFRDERRGGGGGKDIVDAAHAIDEGLLGLGHGGWLHEKPAFLGRLVVVGSFEWHGVIGGIYRTGFFFGGDSNCFVVEEDISFRFDGDTVGAPAGDLVADHIVRKLLIRDF